MSLIKIQRVNRTKPFGRVYLAEVRVFIDGKQATVIDGMGCETFTEVELKTKTAADNMRFMAKCLGHDVNEETIYEH